MKRTKAEIAQIVSDLRANYVVTLRDDMIRDEIDRKVQALLAHVSQVGEEGPFRERHSSVPTLALSSFRRRRTAPTAVRWPSSGRCWPTAYPRCWRSTMRPLPRACMN